jgi:hypothetical protein
MKKFWLCLGIALIMACWCGQGYHGFGTSPAFGQYYYDDNLSCNPSDPNCYNEYYAAPSADPLSQLLYYVAPPVVVEPGYSYGPSYGPGPGYEGHGGGYRGGGERGGGGHGGGHGEGKEGERRQ